jgi:nucleotide-binding universal stress UspA family protein
MKTKKILIPTDFSPNSLNAVQYAISLFNGERTEFLLMNAYHFVPVAAENYMINLVDIEKNSIQGLKQMVSRIRKRFPEKKGLRIHTLSKLGYPTEAIADVVKQEKPDMVVMGTRGATGLQEMLLGSHAASAVKDLNCPVLVIPEKVKYKTPQKMVAADLKNMHENHLMDPIAEMAKKFHATVLIIHVEEKGEDPVEETIQQIKLDAVFADVPHSFHIIEQADPAKGIEEFMNTHQADMLTMVARKHNFPETLFHKSATRKMAMHTKIPLLALHEN